MPVYVPIHMSTGDAKIAIPAIPAAICAVSPTLPMSFHAMSATDSGSSMPGSTTLVRLSASMGVMFAACPASPAPMCHAEG